MPLKLIIHIAKKMPGPAEYSSHQASCSIEGDLAHGQDPTVEAARLYALAEFAVDQQLGLTPAAKPQPSNVAVAAPTLTFENGNPPRQSPAAGQPRSYPRAAARRPPAPATDSQLRFLDRLITQTGTSTDAICSAHRVGSLADLSCKEAAGVIDELKSRSAAA